MAALVAATLSTTVMCVAEVGMLIVRRKKVARAPKETTRLIADASAQNRTLFSDCDFYFLGRVFFARVTRLRSRSDAIGNECGGGGSHDRTRGEHDSGYPSRTGRERVRQITLRVPERM